MTGRMTAGRKLAFDSFCQIQIGQIAAYHGSVHLGCRKTASTQKKIQVKGHFQEPKASRTYLDDRHPEQTGCQKQELQELQKAFQAPLGGPVGKTYQKTGIVAATAVEA